MTAINSKIVKIDLNGKWILSLEMKKFFDLMKRQIIFFSFDHLPSRMRLWKGDTINLNTSGGVVPKGG
jgi:hypothetical protein